jgi:hypothetical protein
MIKIESPDLQHLAVGSKAYGKALRSALRKEITGIAKKGVTTVKSTIRGMPVKGDVPYRQAAGLRQAIANATRASTAITAANGVSASIRVGKGGGLAANNRWRVAQLINRGPFRHPLFGEWVEGLPDQPGFPYFDKPLLELAPEMMVAANVAVLEAARATLPNVT